MASTLKFKCPRCGSGNTKSLSMIYKGGLSYYAGGGTSHGSSIGRGGARFFTSRSSHAGTRQTALSQEADPGFPLSLLLIPLVVIVAFVAPVALTFLVVAGAVVLVWSDIDRRSSCMDAWRKTWRCLRCGEHFMVVPVDGSEQEAGQVTEPSSPPASAASPVPTAVPQVDEASPLPLPAVFRSGGRQATERSRLGEAPGGTMKSARDFTQYTFDGQTFGKGRLVLALIRRYIADHPGTDFAALREAFPDALQADSPLQFSTAQVVVAKLADVADGDRQRFFDKADELIDVADAKVVVSREWNRHNILNVLARAESLGYQVKLAEKEA